MTQPSSEPASDFAPTDLPKPPLNKVVFFGSAAGTVLVALWAMLLPDNAAAVLGVVVGWTSAWFGWFYVLLAAAALVFVAVIALSRYGSIRIGPDHSRPEFRTISWASMLFAAGIGTDLMFFAVAEPVTHYMAPPSGDPQTVQAARESIAWTLFHYGISGWAMYALMGMALGYFAYRLHLPLAIRSALYPLLGKRIDGPIGDAVDLAAVLGTIFGVATSLGIGVVMINVGLEVTLGIEEGPVAQIALIVLGVGVATVSAVSGVNKGIRLLSELNVLLAVALSIWVLVAGKTDYLLNALALNIGDFLRLFPEMVLQTFPYEDTGTWMSDWTLFFWAWWIAWASFVGLFLARISRGRTLRQFVSGVLIIPFSYILMWISLYGNAALDVIRGGNEQFGLDTMENPERGFYALLAEYPAFVPVAILATATALLFYITSADSAALVMANLTSRLKDPRQDAATAPRVFWALATGALTIAVLGVGGIPALQSATVIMGLPFAFVMVAVMLGLFRSLRMEGTRTDGVRAAIPSTMSGRSEAHAAGTWRARLRRALAFPTLAQADEYLAGTVRPALEEVAAEVRTSGAAIGLGDVAVVDSTDPDTGAPRVTLTIGDEDDPTTPAFMYAVHREAVAVPTYAGRARRGDAYYGRLEVHLASGGQGYDIMGYSSGQVIGDVLDQYERYLEFLRLSQPVSTR
jgi:choline/glycine/proline betaine transport protein